MVITLEQPIAQLVAEGIIEHIPMPYPLTTTQTIGVISGTVVEPHNTKMFRIDKVKIALAVKGYTSFDKLKFGEELCRIVVNRCEEVTDDSLHKLPKDKILPEDLFKESGWMWSVKVVSS